MPHPSLPPSLLMYWVLGAALMCMACQDPEPLAPRPSPDASPDLLEVLDMTTPRDARPDAAQPTQDLGLDLGARDLGDSSDAARADMTIEDASFDLAPSPEVLRTFLYVGGQNNGGFVSRFRLDEGAGEFVDAQRLLGRGGNLSYMAIDASRALLHAVDEASTDLYTMRIDLETGLREGEESRANGRCHGVHAMLDASGEHLVMSCYAEGKTSLLRLSDTGTSLEWVDTVDSGRKSHQAMRSPDGRHVFVVSLEDEHIARYQITGDALRPAEPVYTQVPGRIGPRHMAFHPTLSRAYILGELEPVLVTASYTSDGTLEDLDSTAIDEGSQSFQTTGAAIRVHPSGRWVLSTQRFGDNRDGRIVVTELDSQGRPTANIRHSSSLGQTPRDLSMSHDGSLVAVSNRRSGTVAIFGFDERTGELTPRQQLNVSGAPYTVLFLDVLEPSPR